MSFALRAAMGAALVVLALTVAGAVWGLLRAEQALRQQLDLVLAGEAEAFLREYQELGLPALAAAVETTARRRGPLRAA
ncbi:MAG: hypothetical protein K2X11_15960, partial [Acetobacteraceae bacterium]|nr:hypothetical protein [Acetobacteraceae bacterium]